MDTNSKPTSYWHWLTDGMVQCDLCPRNCKLHIGQRGFCYVRGAEESGIVLHAYGMSTGLSVDPIEKKPLYHFFPGSSILSFGTIGCNLACKFCQNWRISRSTNMEAMYGTSAEEMVEAAVRSGVHQIAFTYNDPIVFMEFARDVAELAAVRQIKSVAVTAGCISEEARPEFFSFIDAANVDLKAINENFYRKYTGGWLQPVLDTLTYIKDKTDVWLEVTNLLIPGLNDSESELNELSEWLVDNLGTSVPLHFSAFHPSYKFSEYERTPLATLQKARQIALSKGMNYVYTGNVYDPEGSATYCPGCGKLLIGRNGYETTIVHPGRESRCVDCGTQIAGVFAA